MILHLVFLKENSSSNPLGVDLRLILFIFILIIGLKIYWAYLCFFLFFSFFVFLRLIILGHPDNYIMANPMVTPPHIVPEWYFLPYYAILRSIPDKLLGVLAMVFSILILVVLPFFAAPSRLRAFTFRPLSKLFFYFFVCDALILGWIGQCPAEMPYILIGQIATIFYFLYFILITPAIIYLENFFYEVKSETEVV